MVAVLALAMLLVACSSASDGTTSGQQPTPLTDPISRPSEPAHTTVAGVDDTTGSTGASPTANHQSTDPEAPVDTTRPGALPLHLKPGSRLLWGADDQPFLLVGDAAWSLIAELDREEVDQYIASRKRRGFNTVLVSLIEHRFSSDPPNDAAGDPPFTTPGDFSTPNEAYFEHADWVLQRLADAGFVVLLTPDYAGWEGGDDGWWQEMEATDPSVLEAYGRFVGSRYAHFDNIIWVNGGDYDPSDPQPIDAVARGISATDPDALQTAHLVPNVPPRTYWNGAPWLDLDNVYTYDPVYDEAAAAYRGSTKPFFLMESAYENEHGVSTRELRTQAYQALLTGATGHVFGNNPIWHFSGPGIFDAPVTWQEALDGPGSTSMQAISRFMTAIDWWSLRPDLDVTLVVDGIEGGRTRVAAARAEDDTWAVAYVPTHRAITVDAGRLAGVGVHATWYDASTGLPMWETDVADDGNVRLETPGPNSAGDDDWVVVLTASVGG